MSYKIPITQADFERNHQRERAKQSTQTERKNEILKGLEEIKTLTSKTAYDYASEPFKYDYLELDNRTDEELEKLARESVLSNKAQAEKKLTESTQEKKSALSEGGEERLKQLQKRNEQTAERYENAKSNASNDAIKRGIGRSSIIVNLLKDYDLNKLAEINDNNENYRLESAKIQEKIDKLDSDLKKSLEELDFESAIETNEKIEELKRERDEANQKVIKYNNSVTETLNSNKLDYMGSSAVKKAMENDKQKSDTLKKGITYEIIDYYSGLTYEEALKDFNESGYENYLDENQVRLIKNYLQQLK